MRIEKPEYEKDVEGLLADLDDIGTWTSESGGDGGTDYRVFPAEESTIEQAVRQVEDAPVPGGHPITVSSATDEWFWVCVTPRADD